MTRKDLPPSDDLITWHSTERLEELADAGISRAVCVAHIWVVNEYLAAMRQAGIERLVALSTTSLFTKRASTSEKEYAASQLFEKSERELQEACAALGIGCTILRPTMIYGGGQDKNVAEIAGMIRRFGFFPLFGPAGGLRQPIRNRDVAKAALQACDAPAAVGRAYNISGGEVVAYREMVRRIFAAMNRRLFTPTIPLWLFRGALAIMRQVPRFAHWTPDMAMRMNADQAFDNSEAARDFGFSPEPFDLTDEDVRPEPEFASPVSRH